MTDSISIQVQPTFWTAYRASLRLVALRPSGIVSAAIFPLGALFLLYLHARQHRWPLPGEWVAIVAGLGFTPLILALTLFLSRRRNMLAKSPITYSFTDQGIQTSTPLSTAQIKWDAVVRAVETRNFLYLFIGASRAFYIPVWPLQEAELTRLRSLLKAHISKLTGPAW